MKPASLTRGAVFIALGVVLPMAFHLVGLGKTFLPMHIPVLLAGFLCTPGVAVAVGIITPLLSAVLTGMPPLSPPIALQMAVELPIYALIASFAYQKLNKGVLISLAAAMSGGRLVYGLTMWLMLPLFGLEGIHPLYPIGAGFISSLPGVIVQLVMIPPTVALVERLDYRFTTKNAEV